MPGRGGLNQTVESGISSERQGVIVTRELQMNSGIGEILFCQQALSPAELQAGITPIQVCCLFISLLRGGKIPARHLVPGLLEQTFSLFPV